MNKKLFVSLLVAAVAASPAGARQLSPAEALNMAIGSGNSVMNKAPFRATPVKVGQKAGLNTYYIYDNPSGGYIIASADDVAVPLLGYSDSGSIDPDNIPPNMQEWLDFYSSEIYAAIASGKIPGQTVTRAKRADYAPVAPLVKSKWNQSEPFNNACPVIDGKRCVTGCSATAMAQIMNFWRYPSVGSGTCEYSYTYNNRDYTWSLDLATAPFNWSAMLDVYTPGYSDTEAAAVATLMKACGISIQSSYTPSSTGATISNVGKALLGNFGYGESLSNICRDYYNYSEWVDMVYSEIAASRPVYYTGHNTSGHAFVCDGYSAGGYFHINWGWGGTSDGYYLLSALDPASQGIGGSNAGYNAAQELLISIAPSSKGLPASTPQMRISGDIIPEADSYTRSSSVNAVFNIMSGNNKAGLWNFTMRPISGTFGFRMTDTEGQSTYLRVFNFSELGSRYGWNSISVATSRFPVGTYTLTPVFMVDDVWYDVLTIPSATTTISATVTDTTVRFSMISPDNSVEVTALTLNAPLYAGTCNSFTTTMKATGEFYGDITPMLLDEDNRIIAQASTKNLTILDGETTDVTWIGTFDKDNITPGEYILAFVRSNMEVIPKAYRVSIAAKPASGSLTVGTLSVDNPISGNGTRNNPYIISPDNFSVSARVSANGFFRDIVKLGFFDATTGASAAWAESAFLSLDNGQSTTFTLHGPVSELQAGAPYMVIFWGQTSGQLSMPPYTYAIIDNTPSSGIDNPTPGNDMVSLYPNPVIDIMYIDGIDTSATLTLYTGTGTKVMSSEVEPGLGISLSGIIPGHYIAVIDGNAGLHVVKHIIKR